MPISYTEQEKKILHALEKSKQHLEQLQGRRASEVGKLACKAGLGRYEDAILKPAFAQLKKELDRTNPSNLSDDGHA